ncbi:unnamed protein product, partial [Symbiodinium necroappetens]
EDDDDGVAPDLLAGGAQGLDEVPAEGEPGNRPQSKQELNKIRESLGNTQQLCAHFYRDRSLRDDLLLVSTASRPTMAEYQQTLLDQKTQESALEFQTRRATGSWYKTVMKTLNLIHDPRALRRFGTTISPSAPVVTDDDPRAATQWFCSERRKLDDFWSLLTEIASARVWSQIQFATCVPNTLVAALHANSAVANESLQEQRRTWAAVLHTEKLLANQKLEPGIHESLLNLMNDMAWNRLQVARETFLVCQRG